MWVQYLSPSLRPANPPPCPAHSVPSPSRFAVLNSRAFDLRAPAECRAASERESPTPLPIASSWPLGSPCYLRCGHYCCWLWAAYHHHHATAASLDAFPPRTALLLRLSVLLSVRLPAPAIHHHHHHLATELALAGWAEAIKVIHIHLHTHHRHGSPTKPGRCSACMHLSSCTTAGDEIVPASCRLRRAHPSTLATNAVELNGRPTL